MKKTRMSYEKKLKFYQEGLRANDRWLTSLRGMDERCKYTPNSTEEYYWWLGATGRKFTG